MAKQYPRKAIGRNGHFSKRIIIGIIFSVVFALFIVIAALHFFLSNKPQFSPLDPEKDDGFMEDDLIRLSEEKYEGVLLSMHSTKGFSQEDFAYYRGLDTLIVSHAILNTRELSQYLDCILESGNHVTNLYLCLDPELLWTSIGEKESMWNTELKAGLYSYIADNPDILFEILLPYPYIDYWLELSDDKLDRLLSLYRAFAERLFAYPNAKVFFPGFEYWLMVNPDNYADSWFTANEIITQKLFLYTFCDGVYQITQDNEDSFWNSLRETIMREKNTPADYPDLSQWHLVFFGDSVLANYPGSYSIPGYMAGLSNITFDNYAVGGTRAVFTFSGIVDTFIAEKQENVVEQLWPPAGKSLCFIINYGINDYFTGDLIDNPLDALDEGTYKGSLRVGISRLQEIFPDASYIVMTPTHVGFYENGTMVMSEEGDVFAAYIEAAREISEEMGLYLIDNYDDFIITVENLAEYIGDGVHPNEKGRLAIAARIMEFLKQF